MNRIPEFFETMSWGGLAATLVVLAIVGYFGGGFIEMGCNQPHKDHVGIIAAPPPPHTADTVTP